MADEPKIKKDAPLIVPEFYRNTGTVELSDRQVYNDPEAKSWKDVPVLARKRQLPIAYLAEGVAWQIDGSEPADSPNILVWSERKRYPVKSPRTVVLRGFFSDTIKDGLKALADTLIAAGILVIIDPYNSFSLGTGPGLWPALPVTNLEIMEPGHQEEPQKVALVFPNQFLGGEILEFVKGSERDSFGFYRTALEGTGSTTSIPGYDQTHPDITTAIRSTRTISDHLEDIAAGTGHNRIDSYRNSTTIVLQPNGSPPPAFIIHVMGVNSGPDQSYGAPRFPVIHDVANQTYVSFRWQELMDQCAGYFTNWIPRCTKYAMYVLMETDTPVNPPIESHSDTNAGKIDFVIIDGINPNHRSTVSAFMTQVDNTKLKLENVTSGDGLETETLQKMKEKIASFFDITL